MKEYHSDRKVVQLIFLKNINGSDADGYCYKNSLL